jgi:Na+/melibiose symporter-like transporter
MSESPFSSFLENVTSKDESKTKYYVAAFIIIVIVCIILYYVYFKDSKDESTEETKETKKEGSKESSNKVSFDIVALVNDIMDRQDKILSQLSYT